MHKRLYFKQCLLLNAITTSYYSHIHAKKGEKKEADHSNWKALGFLFAYMSNMLLPTGFVFAKKLTMMTSTTPSRSRRVALQTIFLCRM